MSGEETAVGQFHIASDEEIKRGQTTDIYFIRTEEILRAKGLDKVRVTAEVTTGDLPDGWPWAVLCGQEEAAHLLEGCPVNVDAMPEGTVFRSRDVDGLRVPVMSVSGAYSAFSCLETPLLGLLCQSSGISTRAARIRKAADERLVLDFGARRMHPALSPLIGRSAYIGGVEGVSSVAAAKLIGIEPSGTMPHALVIVFGDQNLAWKAFDEVVPEQVPRVVLVDTYLDEKVEAVMAAELLRGRLWGVRLDTPRSRRGDIVEIVREVRWELDIRGFRHVKIFVSGGLTEESVRELSKAGVEGFGVGTWICNAPTVDFALDIVEVEGRFAAKRGKLSGCKKVWRCQACMTDKVLPEGSGAPFCPKCGAKMEPLLQPMIRDGRIVAGLPEAREIRRRCQEQLGRFE